MPIRDQRLLDGYAEDVVFCELCDLLHCCRRGNGEVHHITGGTSQRHDKLTNIVMLCRSAHRWVQEIEIIPGRILCLWTKQQRGQLDWGFFAEQHQCQWAWCEYRWAERRERGPVLYQGRDITLQVERCLRQLGDDFRLSMSNGT
jgi:hypothetical protein